MKHYQQLISHLLTTITQNKNGLEIGGPSTIGKTIYQSANQLDNVVFANHTVWSTQKDIYPYGKHAGKVIVNDATQIVDIHNEQYDFVFASHTLEHIANPIKALNEWLRVVKNGGYLILVVPEKSQCFDHNRKISSFETIVTQYKRGVNEDDLSTLPEILRFHDLSMDPPAGTFEQFTKRCLDNHLNRCMHHYVYDVKLLTQICTYLKCKFIYTKTLGINLWFIVQKNKN